MQILKQTAAAAFLGYGAGGGNTDIFYRCHTEADGAVGFNGEILTGKIYMRGKHAYALIPAILDIQRGTGAVAQKAVEHCGHEFAGVVVLKVGGLVCNHRIAGGVGFVEGVGGEGGYLIKHLFGGGFINAVVYRALYHRYAVFRKTVYEYFALLCHGGGFLFAHGSAHKVAAPERIARHVAHHLHYLLLIHHAAVGDGKGFFQYGVQIGYALGVLFALDIFGYALHGAGAVEGNAGYDILKAGGHKLLHKGAHAAAFQLEHALVLSCSERIHDLFIIIIDVLEIELHTAVLFDHLHRVLDDSECAESQEVHL